MPPPHLLLIFYLYSQSSIRLRNGINKSDLNFHLNLKNVVKKFLSFLNLIFYANPHFFIPIHIFLFCFLSNWLIFNVKYCFCPLFAQNRRKSNIFLNFFREPKKNLRSMLKCKGRETPWMNVNMYAVFSGGHFVMIYNLFNWRSLITTISRGFN